MKYLFTTPKPTLELEETPVGLAYVAAALRQTGRSISTFNFTSMNSIDDLLCKIEDDNTDVLCIGALSAQYPALKSLITAVRNNYPDVKILVGGGIITAEPEFVIQHLDIDFGCIGYGEELICEFAECLENNGDFSIIKGLIYKDCDGKLTINPSRPEPVNIDNIPYPAIDMFGFVGGTLFIAGSRSCIYNCTFCFHPSGYKYKERSLNSIFAEIDYWKQRYNISTVAFIDELFGKNKERVIEFCERFTNIGMNLYIQLRVDIVTEDLIIRLKNAKCTAISFGIESVNQSVLNSMRKSITVEQIENALSLARKYEITIVGNLIFGDKAETFDIANESLSWWFKNSHYGLNLDLIRAHPGTALYKYGVENGRIDRLDFLEKGCPVVNLSAMSDTDFSKLKRKMELMRNMIGEPITNPRIEENENGHLLFCGDCPNCNTSNYVRIENFNKSVAYMNSNFCIKCGSKVRITNHFMDFFNGSEYFSNYDYTNKRIAIWGATQKAQFRMASNKEFKKAVVAVVDTNYKDFSSNHLIGIPVQPPESLYETDFNVLYIGARFLIARQSIIDCAKGIIKSNTEIMPFS